MTANHLTGVGSGKPDWQTPPSLFKALNRTFRFDYDAFASHENALCLTYSTEEGTYRKGGGVEMLTEIDSLDGLRQDWDSRRVFMNPPYRRGFLEQALMKAVVSQQDAALIAALIPASTDTTWWHRWVKPYAEVHFIPRRVRFIDPATGLPGQSPPGGSAIAIYYPEWM